MKLLFATDPHGNQAAYDDLLARARGLDVQTLVLGGDLLPLAHGGDRLAAQLRFAREWLPGWLERARAQGARVFAVMGNDDWACCAPHLARLEREGLFALLHGRAAPLDEARWIAGYPCVPVTPFSMSDWDRLDAPGWRPPRPPKNVVLSDVAGEGGRVRAATLEEVAARPSIEEDLEALALQSDPARTVYVVHTPPWGAALDVMHGGAHIGSRALRAFIDRRQPPLTLHGHVHESPRLTGRIDDRIGRTLAVNPGASRQRLRAAFVDLERLDERARLVT
ncbi:MAG: metallophosphoesterase [Planctomycetes bacterium]|nr:metallophosphoesterase [Planctomycetota bacterium]